MAASMLRTTILAAALVLLPACPSQNAAPPPGVTVGPGGVTAPGVVVGPGGVSVPGVTVGPGGITAPGVTVGPGGITAPGVTVGPGGITAPGVTVGPGGITAPGVTVPAPPAALLGIAECDAYVMRACSCTNESARAAACQGARVSLEGWRGALAVGADSGTITNSCREAVTALLATCP